MTIFAGILSRTDATVDEPTREQLRRAISRRADTVLEFGNRRAFLAKIDLGIFGAPAAHEDRDGNVSLLAGEPLLYTGSDGGNTDRSADLQKLHSQWVRSDWSGLTQCTGTYCAAHFSPTEHRVSLIADKVGLRPIYYWITPQWLVFATALRILESFRLVPLTLDVRGVTEIAVFGFPLGERTAYSGISTIYGGQIVDVSVDGVREHHYWQWDKLPPMRKDLSEVSRDTYRAFQSAVARRKRGERSAVAFLSGGLDSRCIVAVLKDQGAVVHTLNFGVAVTQDRVFGADFARAVGTQHHEIGADFAAMYAFRGRNYNQQLVSKLFDSDPDLKPLRRTVWSGDGGSVAVGHVYLNEEIANAAPRNMEEAIDALMRYNKLFASHRRIIRPGLSDMIAKMPAQGIREEIARFDCSDPARSVHLFLMLNDQRRHLANFYENIDLDRVEFQLPFFDSEVLEPILTSPIEGFLRHEFYMTWLGHFPRVALSVPWQAYPGHVPCPLPTPERLVRQWDADIFSESYVKQAKRTLVSQIDKFLKSPNFPRSIVSPNRLRGAKWLTHLGIRNYDYVLKAAAVYCRYAEGGARMKE